MAGRQVTTLSLSLIALRGESERYLPRTLAALALFQKRTYIDPYGTKAKVGLSLTEQPVQPLRIATVFFIEHKTECYVGISTFFQIGVLTEC